MIRKLTLCSLLCAMTALPAYGADSEESLNIESESRIQISEVKPSETKTTLNVQLGASSLGYSGDSSGDKNSQGLATGVTVELGRAARFLETGLMYYQTRSEIDTQTLQNKEVRSSYIALPLMAKFYTSGGSKGFFLKGGMLTSFLTTSNSQSDVRSVDLMGSLGAGGRFVMTPKADFVVEGAYNHGFLDQLKSTGETIQRGFTVFAGVAFGI